jgi:hypothetical protein
MKEKKNYIQIQFVKWTSFILLCFFANAACAQLYPEYDTKPRKKKQQVVARIPPQFHSRDTTALVRDSIAKANAAKGITSKQLVPGGTKTGPSRNGIPGGAKALANPARADSFVRIISKKEDANGNITTIQEVTIGKRKLRQTIVTGGMQLNKPFRADTIDKDSITIQVVKKNHRMYVYHKHRFLTAYKCVFGPPYLEQKQMEGDRKTPEGFFKILEIRPQKDWTLFMLLDYPNEASFKNFEDNKRTKAIPATARIGGAVGIHGTWADADMVVDQKRNWTDGCICLKNADLLELSKIVKPGTSIFVRKANETK